MPYRRSAAPILLVMVVVVIMPAIVGCAVLAPLAAPGCQGPRRPANPHGSVLAPAEPPIPTSSSAPGGGTCGPRP